MNRILGTIIQPDFRTFNKIHFINVSDLIWIQKRIFDFFHHSELYR